MAFIGQPAADPPNSPYGVGGFGSGLLGNQPIEALPLGYYLQLLSSEYQPPNSPKWNAFLLMLLRKFDDASQCLMSMDTAFDLDYAVGVQLDTLGVIAGVSRTVPFQPSMNGSGYVHVINASVAWETGTQFPTDGSWNGLPIQLAIGNYTILSVSGPTGLTLTTSAGGNFADVFYQVAAVSPVLDDATYRTLIKATIAQNQWDGTITGMQAIWQSLFPGGTIVIADNQNMTATIILSGTFSSIIQDLITHGMVVPRPEGVLYNIVFGDLPKFGADLNNGFVAGADLGHAT